MAYTDSADMVEPGPEEPGFNTPPPPPKFHDVTVVTKKNYGCAKVMAVPPEEFGICKRARCIKEADYTFHETPRPQHELLTDGYDPDQINNLPSYVENSNVERRVRSSVKEDDLWSAADSVNRATRLVMITEHYMRMDYEGNGEAKLYKVTTGGDQGEILRCRKGDKGKYEDDIEEVDGQPFAIMTPVIIPHRVIGRSIADLVMDIQKIKTALLRALLDNAYLANNPRPEVGESGMTDNTLDDLLTWRPGAPIRVRQPGTVVWQTIPAIGNQVYPLMEYLDSTREMRTGYTRAGAGLDANVLQNMTATAAGQLMSMAQARIKLIARIFAETGFRDMFLKLHEIIRKNDTAKNTVRLRNTWTTVDPRQWKTRSDMTVNVGLGNGNKDQQLMGLMSIGLDMEKLLAAQQLNMVDRQHIFEYEKAKCNLLGYKNPERFFNNPTKTQPGQPQPDPKVQEAQIKAQVEQQKATQDIQLTQAKNQADMQMNAAKMQSEGQLAQARMQAEFALKREQMMGEFALEREKMAAEIELEREKIRLQATVSHNVGMANADAKLSGVRMGGEIG